MELGIGILIGIALSALAVYVGKKYDIPTEVEGVENLQRHINNVMKNPPQAQIIKRKSPEQEIDEMLKHE